MVIDTSALVAILLGESERDRLIRCLADADRRLMCAFSRLEAGIVMETRKGAHGGIALTLLIERADIELVPFDAEQQILAMEAWRRFGKGRHPARLNIGDCCSYALAASLGEPLLFKGNDFSQTDLALCVY